ncbi:hypothetical protein ARMSODRAFT_978890 [Armillaria solidipes]|uniref:CCHC-type domain-containing protein n=1 Tax=Armillaria solidipes TaxID=1076256 RepID=A0A2H3BJ99_9AGAR|nr:hypothetical protein ARMSODRAFT_978890 [Armillaria solidipes]
MSQQPMEHPGQPTPSLHSSHPSLQDYPPLPMSKTSDKKEDTSSMKSMKRSLRSRIPFFRKGSKSLLPQAPPSPVLNFPSENPESLLSSVQTLRLMTTTATDPTPPPSQNILSGKTITESSSPLHEPAPMYDELIQQVAKLRQEKSSRNSQRETTRLSAPMPVTELLLTSTAAQLAQDWRAKPTPSIGRDSKVASLRPMPSARLTQKSSKSTRSNLSRSGWSDTDSIAPTRSSKDSLGSLSIRGWSNEPVPELTNMTSQEREARFMNIWHSRQAAILTEVTWMHSEEGQAWRLADPAEQEDILSYSADVQAITIFNERYPRQVQAGSGSNDARGSNQPPPDNPMLDDQDDSDIEIEEPKPTGSGKAKGKKLDAPWQPGTGFFKGDRPPDHYSDPVARNPERWSLPRAPNKFDPESDPPNPIGTMGEDTPWVGCKPDLIRKPLPFTGEPDDIDRFIMDCQMYFQVHSAYMWLNPYRVAFTSSYFEGRAKDWWTLQLAELYSTSWGKYRFPTWSTSLRQGVPTSYTTMIANIGVGIPVRYDQWREQIETMNEERQRKEAIDAVGGMYQPRPPQSKNTQSSRMPKPSATTTPTKKTATGTVYGGQGQPMDIDAIKSGDCFCCGKKGHISKNCPLQSWNKGKKQEVRASTTESTDSKIEEVKDAAGK